MEWDLEKLATFFYDRGDFKETFIPLVPWNELSGDPNAGHAAIADMLISRAAHGALSANFDTMIERWAETRKVDLRGALTGQQAIEFDQVSKPLLKFHGCMSIDRENTLWTQNQLNDEPIKSRIQSCSDWMTQNLPGKHLVVVGFWTDWLYLNDVLAKAFTITNAASVTVIDKSPEAELKKKAPLIWQKLNALSNDFEHLEASSDIALDELRCAYSKVWAKKFYDLGKQMAAAKGITAIPSPDALSMSDLYDLRRDVEGVSYARAAKDKEPQTACGEAALAHIELLASGGTQVGPWIEHSGRKVRIVNGAGRQLEGVKEAHNEPATLQQPDIVICTGSADTGLPSKLIATGVGASVVSAAPGGAARWLTLKDARKELGL
jgi:hypothetical protein